MNEDGILMLLGGLIAGGLGTWWGGYQVGQRAVQGTLQTREDALAQREIEVSQRAQEATQRSTEAEALWERAVEQQRAAQEVLRRAAQCEAVAHEAMTVAQRQVEAAEAHWRTWAAERVAQAHAEVIDAERRRRNATATAERRRRKLVAVQSQRSHPAS
jgi:hypothetical protein